MIRAAAKMASMGDQETSMWWRIGVWAVVVLLAGCTGEGGQVQILDEGFRVDQARAYAVPEPGTGSAPASSDFLVMVSDRPVLLESVNPNDVRPALDAALKASGAKAITLFINRRGEVRGVHIAGLPNHGGYVGGGGYSNQTIDLQLHDNTHISGRYRVNLQQPVSVQIDVRFDQPIISLRVLPDTDAGGS
jgi:hypothetical protein